MAITIAHNADHKSLTGKTLSIQSELTSKLKTTIVDVTYGGSDNYATNGNTVDLSLGGRTQIQQNLRYMAKEFKIFRTL